MQEPRTTSHQVARLQAGSHNGPEGGVCVMELASMLAGEPFSDQPVSVCPVIGAVLRAYNDLVDEQRRQDLYAYASLVVGSRDSDEVACRRAHHCLLWSAAQRARRPWWRRGRRRRMPGADQDPRQLFLRPLVPLLRRPDDRRHAAVLALIEELLEIRSYGDPRRHRTLRPLPLSPLTHV